MIWILVPIMLAVLIPRYPAQSLALLFGGIALRLSLIFSEYVPLIMVVLLSSIVFEEDLPLVSVGVGSLHITDILLAVLIAKVIHHRSVEKDFKEWSSPLITPLLLFFLMMVFAAANAIFVHGVDATLVIRELRGKCYYLLAIVVMALFRSERQVQFLTRGLLAIGTFVALAMIAQAAVGDSLQLLPGRVESAGTFGSDYSALRILPPGHTLVYILFLVTTCRLILLPKPAPLQYLLVAVLGTGVMLTYNRVYMLAIMIGILVLGWLSRPNERKRVALLAALMVGVLVTTFAAFTLMGGKYAESAASVYERFSSIFAGRELAESSPIEDRVVESEYALQLIKQHPLVGSGLRAVYRPTIYGSRDDLEFYIHNAYLWHLKDGGALGLTTFMWFFAGFVIRGLRNFNKIRDPALRSTLAGFSLSGLGMIPMALANPVFMQWYSIVCIAIVSGLSETIISLNRKAVADEPLRCETPLPACARPTTQEMP